MENASKALLIAGAILICILLIAIGMYIYNSANATVDSAVSQMSQQEKDIYNAKVKSYLGDTVKGSEVKSMIDNIISMNQENVGKSGKFISIEVMGSFSKLTQEQQTALSATKALTNFNTGNNATNGANLATECQKANFYDDGENTSAQVAKATTQMNTLKSKINSSTNYTVVADMEAGAIIRVGIGQLDN